MIKEISTRFGQKRINMINWRGEEIPETVYKYRDWNNVYHRKILFQQELYIPSASEFNDPFDCRPIFSSDLKKNKEILKKQHELFGVYSVTAVNDNILMWAHYANNHKGFCVGFDSFKLFEYLNGGGNVRYEEEYPRIMKDDDNGCKKIKMFYTKAWYWDYEIEYRLLTSNFVKKSKTISKEVITEIILGYKMSESDKKDILKLISIELPLVKIFETKPIFGSFEFEIVPV